MTVTAIVKANLVGAVLMGALLGGCTSPPTPPATEAPEAMDMDHAAHPPTTQPTTLPATQPATPPAAQAGRIPGVGAVHLDLTRVQLIGVKTMPVARTAVESTIRTVGVIAEDERRIHHIHTKFAGWVEDLIVDFTGKEVKQGEPLLTIYSPELVSTQEEYLLALRAQKQLHENTGGADLTQSLVTSARERLLFWDIPEQEIRRLERDGKPRKALTLYAPMDGFVTKLNANHGMYVTPGTMLFMIVDYSHVWVHADLYESDIARVEPGQEASLTVAAYPGETFTGAVNYIYPYMDPETRTVKAQFDFPNADFKLKPGMYAHVEIGVPRREHITVPHDAVLDTGDHTYVFVQSAPGMFEPREIQLGGKTGAGAYVVLDGLSTGDQVVTSGVFLLDSESRLRTAAGGGMSGHQH